MQNELIAAAIILIIIYIAVTHESSPFYGKLPFITNIFSAEGFQGDVNMVPESVLSYYKSLETEKYGEAKIVVGFHYTNWCGYCKQMKPVWQEVKASLNNSNFSSVVMLENDEEKNPTQGVSMYPTIIKYQDGKARRYKGRYDFDELRSFILTPFTVTSFGTMLPS